MSRGRTLVALAAAAGVLAAPAPAAAQLKLRACDHVRCGRIAVPLDRTGAVPGRISLYVERQAARRRPARGVTLLLAGGPGQPATRAYDDGTKDPYGEFRAMAPSNDVVVFDGRGTGRSGLLRCPELERASLVDAGAEAAACARRLGARRGFYRTSDSVEDIEAVRAALGVERLTLLGVSYGTYLAQAYAARYPTRVERVLLDSVLDSWDPFYLDVFAAIPRVLRQVCRISCSRFTDDEVSDLNKLVVRLAKAPLRGKVTVPSGRRRSATLTREQLFFTLVAGDLNEILRGEFPAAVTSALHGDPGPMLRLERHASEVEGGGSPRDFSSGLYAATACEEIPFPWTRFSPPDSRYAQIDAGVARIPASALYPFDAATDAGNDFVRMCRRWPEASPAPAIAPPAGALPDVPVLMLDGEMDTRTPLESARSAAAAWPHAQVLPIPATGHSTLTADFSGCAPKAARRFLRGQSVPARCPGTSAFVALPPAPLSLSELRAARGAPGVRGRAVSAAQLTQLDVTLEFVSTAFSGVSLDLRGGGLRGGRWSLNLDAKRPLLRLEQVEYLPGVVVTGTVYGIGTRRERSVLRLSGPRTPDGVLRIGLRRVTGRLGGRPLHARSGIAAASDGRRLSSARLLRLARQATRRHPFGTTGP